MILETFEEDKTGLFIYSENRFDLVNNFSIIHKNRKQVAPISIHYNDVCRFISTPEPKNVVVYRLLTNLEDVDISFMKYGILVQIQGVQEVIYFDPVFALREIEEYTASYEDAELRFRIQQIGLKSNAVRAGLPDFKEIYSFDLEVEEVKHQNDKVYAEIIFAFTDIDFSKTLPTEQAILTSFSLQEEKKPTKSKFITMSMKDFGFTFTEANPKDVAGGKVKLNKFKQLVVPPENESNHSEKEQEFDEAVEKRKSTSIEGEGKSFNTFNDLLKKSNTAKIEQDEDGDAHDEGKELRHTQLDGLNNIFQPTTQLREAFFDRSKKQVVLKLRKRE